MDYSRIISRSFEIAWKYKSLWIFGMFASATFNFDVGGRQNVSFDAHDFGFPQIPPELLSLFLISGTVLAIVLLVAGQISQAAIIDSANRIERGGRYRFSDAFSAGLDYLWRFLGLFILFFVSVLVPMIILTTIGVVMFIADIALGFLSLLFLLPLTIFIVALLFSIWSLAQRVIVVRNASIGDALEEAFYLVKKNFGKTIVIFVIYIAFTIGFAIAATVLWAMLAVPAAAMGLAGGMDIIQSLFVGMLIGLPVSLVVGGILGVFFTSLYTLFYFELVEPSSAPAAQAPPASLPGE